MKRGTDESFEDYKQRRLAANKAVKEHLKGKLFFNPYPKFLGTSPEGKQIWSSPQSYRKP